MAEASYGNEKKHRLKVFPEGAGLGGDGGGERGVEVYTVNYPDIQFGGG